MPPPSVKVSVAADAAGNPVTAGEVKGDMLAPSIFNNNLLRLAATGAAVALAAKSSVLLPAQGLSFVHLLAYGTWLGSVIWTTFIAGECSERSNIARCARVNTCRLCRVLSLGSDDAACLVLKKSSSCVSCKLRTIPLQL